MTGSQQSLSTNWVSLLRLIHKFDHVKYTSVTCEIQWDTLFPQNSTHIEFGLKNVLLGSSCGIPSKIKSLPKFLITSGCLNPAI